MTRKGRLIFLGLSLIVLLVIGYLATGSFGFALQQFWFTAGLFLLILLSLVDQPHFSKDANIFANGVTAWVSLLLVAEGSRNTIWWTFLAWSSYLIISSYFLMWVRSRELKREGPAIQFISRLNRQIGRPEALFSSLFLWGSFLQFKSPSPGLNALLLFWAVFMIINLPAVSQALEELLTRKRRTSVSAIGVILRLISPRIAEARLSSDLPLNIVGKSLQISKDRIIVGEAVVIDDRFVAGQRIGRLAIVTMEDRWSVVSNESPSSIDLTLLNTSADEPAEIPISVTDVGSEIGKLVFHVHPDLNLQSGEVVWTELNNTTKAFYQIVSGQVFQVNVPEGNCVQSIRVLAGQLGIWDAKQCRFETVTWVPPAGELVHRADVGSAGDHEIPVGHVVVGRVPNSDFPIHINIQEIVTHNSALIGVTGSGKSYLAFHLIEAMAANNIKVMILDMSRQHYLFLTPLNPTPLKTPGDVAGWLGGESLIGIHQYATASASYPFVTSQFVEEAFKELSKTTLKPGENEPARLCVVFEEAHSIIPEWNQVAMEGDKGHVNKTARIILQGRKFGMGSLIVTQRTANVTKTILNQCNTIFALQSFDQTGLDFLKNYMGDEYSHAISTLPTRRAILVGKASSSARPIIMEIDDFSKRWRPAKSEAKAEPAEASTTQTTSEVRRSEGDVNHTTGATMDDKDEEGAQLNAQVALDSELEGRTSEMESYPDQE
ncbi:MAG TPA: DUF87 domain-containing protein [Pyrinomonadaceae bacterium]|nr:DUF87 domain-containing protein [Pyrinomonadaceae bacterium]